MLKRQNQFPAYLVAIVGGFALTQCLGCGATKTEPTDPEMASEIAVEPVESPAPSYSPESFRDAARIGKLSVVEICVESGMDINESDPNGFTALAMAAYNGHDEIVKLLIKNQATIDSRDRQGNTPLIHAASGPYPLTVQILLDAGAEIDAVDGGEQFTALMMAAAMGNIEVVKALLAAGAKKDMVDIDGDSASVFARKEGHSKIVALLKPE